MGLAGAALLGAAGLAGTADLAFSNMATSWSLDAGYRRETESVNYIQDIHLS